MNVVSLFPERECARQEVLGWVADLQARLEADGISALCVRYITVGGEIDGFNIIPDSPSTLRCLMLGQLAAAQHYWASVK